MFIRDFGMDTITLAGSLPNKLLAIREAGFSQVMLSARDLTQHHGGVDEAIACVRASRLRVTGFQVLRDFEGLSGHLHEYKVDVAKSMIGMASAVGAPLLLVCSSTSQHASENLDAIARDLRKLAILAVPTASASPTKVCRGAAISTNTRRPGLPWRARTCRTWAWESTRTTSLPPAHRLIPWTISTRPGCFSCSCRTSCGKKCVPPKNGWLPREPFGSSREKVFMARR